MKFIHLLEECRTPLWSVRELLRGYGTALSASRRQLWIQSRRGGICLAEVADVRVAVQKQCICHPLRALMA